MSGNAPASLLHQVESVPVAAEVLHLAGRELESGPQLAVLEEDVRIAQTRCVEVLSLPLLGQNPLDALDEADLFQNPYLAVTRRDRDPVSLADFLGADLAFIGREKDLGAVLVRQELGRLERREQLRCIREFAVVRVRVILHGSDPAPVRAIDESVGYLSYRA